MQKWEYCTLGPFIGTNSGYYPKWHHYGHGEKALLGDGDEQEKLDETIKELGLAGWELVGCGAVTYGHSGAHVLYFKRPTESSLGMR
jgi:hypothetical protein